MHKGLRAFYGALPDTAVAEGTGLRLLHFDRMTLLHCMFKMLRYRVTALCANSVISALARRMKIIAVNKNAHSEERWRLIWRAAKTISGAQA